MKQTELPGAALSESQRQGGRHRRGRASACHRAEPAAAGRSDTAAEVQQLEVLKSSLEYVKASPVFKHKAAVASSIIGRLVEMVQKPTQDMASSGTASHVASLLADSDVAECPVTQFALGFCYLHGTGLAASAQQAGWYFARAADKVTPGCASQFATDMKQHSTHFLKCPLDAFLYNHTDMQCVQNRIGILHQH